MTILLPLKGRQLHTLRFLYHANRTHLPYRILIADGEVREPLAGVLRDSRRHFPNLDIDYVEYPDDVSFSHFYRKMADAVCRVKTPFVMQADNDDFVIASGLERAIDFLEANPGFVCYCSSTPVFSIYSRRDDAARGVCGHLNWLHFGSKGSYRSNSLSSTDIGDRIRDGGRCTGGLLYYGVFRSEALTSVCREIAEFDFSDLQVHEIFFTLRTLAEGKAQAEDDHITYLRQIGTSMRSAFKYTWLYHILRSRFTSDVQAAVDRIAEIAATRGASRSAITEDLYAIFETRIGHLLRGLYGTSHHVRQGVKAYVPRLVDWYKNRRRLSIRRERLRLTRQLKSAGATPNIQKQFDRELSEIEETLSGDDFAKFLVPYLATAQW